MELVLATSSLANPGGSETYLVTVAAQLQRLGYGVTLYAQTLGPIAQEARAHGLRIAGELEQLPESCDAVLVQDGAVSYQLAGHYRDAPQLFRAASELHDLQLPPNLPGVVGKVIVLSDRVARRVRALAQAHDVVRLRQPVDTERFKPIAPINAVPRRAVLLGNYLQGQRLRTIVAALADSGIECVQVGRNGSVSLQPEQAIWDADIVVAKGRAALEGMACGRAVFVYDEFGADGWITAERYPAIEADNFAGQATDMSSDPDRLRDELSAYSADMAIVNRDLALRNHGARAHANELSTLFAGAAAPSPPAGSPLPELSRLVRLQWQTAGQLDALERTHAQAWARVAELEHSLEVLSAEYSRMKAIAQTRRYRAAMALGRLADRLRDRAGAR